MSQLADVERRIIDLCDERDGFLVPLGALREFNHQKYQELKSNITTYNDLLKGSVLINRQIVGCLFALIQVLETAVEYEKDNPTPNAQSVNDALIEMWEFLMDELFWIPSETENK